MRRLLVAAAGLGLLVGIQFVANCSNPLEVNRDVDTRGGFNSIDTLTFTDTLMVMDTVMVSDSMVRVDTVIVTDSVVFSDTVYVSDTVYQIDTVVVTDSVVFPDTVIVVDSVHWTDTLVVIDTLVDNDTVFVEVPDTNACPPLCSQINSHQHKIIWLLNNTAGRYRLDFAALAERDQPAQKLIVTVDGVSQVWRVRDSNQLTLDLDLHEDAHVIIELDQPNACGHSIAVCLTVKPL